MTAEENKAIVRRYLEELWIKGNWSVAEEVVAEDVVFHDQVREGELPPGREGLREAVRRMRTGIPDNEFHIDDMVAEGDRVVIRWHATGTHTGDFNGMAPTLRRATLYGISMVRLEDGRIVEGWQEADRMGLAQELGIMPKGQMPKPVAAAISGFIRTKDKIASRRG